MPGSTNAKSKSIKDSNIPTRHPEPIPAGATPQAHARRPALPGGAPGSAAGTPHAEGIPGGGAAAGGLAGTNIGTGAPVSEEEFIQEEETENAYAGMAGGAVGGTPAQKRTAGGRIHRGIAPGGVHRGDSTVGTDPRSGTE